MGKAAKPSPTGRFRLYKTSRNKANQPLVVQIEYTVKSIAIRRSTGIYALEKDWNPKENQCRGGLKASYGPDYRNVNNRLLKRATELDTKIAEWVDKHPNQLTVDIVRAFLDNLPTTRDDNGIDFADFITTNLKNEKERNKIGVSVYKNGISGMNIFGQFLKSEKLGTYAPGRIYLSEISPDIIEKYIQWRRNIKNNSNETINHALTPILKGCQLATTQGYLKSAVNAIIQQMRIAKTKSLQENDISKVKHLTKEQLECLIGLYHNDQEERRKEYIEMFLFALYGCGLRLVDILTLQWSNIDLKNRTINKIQVKTRNRNIVPITEQAFKILEKWTNRHDRFIFGLLPDDFDLDDSAGLYLKRNNITKCINQSLNTLSRKMGLPFELTFHVARHTFAVHSLNNGVPMTMVSQLLGHSSTEITEKVYAHFVPATLCNELLKIKLPSI